MKPVEFTTMPLADLSPAPYNPRQISEEALAGLRASVERFGLVEPVIWNRQTGHVVGGHQRIKALQAIGETETNVVIVDLPEIEEKALNVALNNPAIAGDFTPDLHALLAEITAELPDLASLLRLDSLATLTADLLKSVDLDGGKDPDEAPDLQAIAITQPGDMWTLGNHRLLCGDATDQESYLRLLNGATADMVFTDPPYNVAYETDNHAAIANDNLGAGFGTFLRAAFTPMLAACNGAVYVCMSSSELDVLQAAFRAAGGHWSTFVVWAKDRFTLGRSDYQRQYEPILYGWREGSRRHWCGDRSQGDVWQVDRPAKNDLHPTMKPVALVERALNNSCRLGGAVLDPFAGSGTCAIASERTGRMARMIEIDPLYCDVIVRRWEEYTGKIATRVSATA